jgi:polyhydroxybutyrate depolymerase
LTTHKLRFGGADRTYHVHTGKAATTGLPVVLVLHGGGGNGKLLKDTYGFKPFIERGEFVAVYPDAVKGEWMPDDVAFVDAVIDEVFAREKVDRDRLFVTGASRGGLLTLVMAAKSKHTIRAAGTVITTQLQGLADEFPIERPIDFAMIAGTADPLMPYAGGWGSFGKPKNTGDPKARSMSVEDTIGLLLKANDISGKPKVTSLGNKDPSDGCTNEVRTWTHPKTNRRVMLVKVEGGGHVVPGGGQYLPKDLIGPACKDFDHAEVMLDFFKTGGPAEKPAPNDQPAVPAKMSAESEKALRERVKSLYEATLAGEIDKCLGLADPATVQKTGKAEMEIGFKALNGLMKLGKVGKDDHRVHSITPSEDGKSATVKTELRLGGKWQPPGTEIWLLVDDKWYYRETPKK